MCKPKSAPCPKILTSEDLVQVYANNEASQRLLMIVTEGNKYIAYGGPLTQSLLTEIVYYDSSSSGRIRFRERSNRNKAIKAQLTEIRIPVATVSEIDRLFYRCKQYNEAGKTAGHNWKKYNRGDILERILCRRYEKGWRKDISPFWQKADITINGLTYQVKSNDGVFTTGNEIWRNRTVLGAVSLF